MRANHRWISFFLTLSVVLGSIAMLFGVPGLPVPEADAAHVQYQDPTWGCPGYTFFAVSSLVPGQAYVSWVIKPDDLHPDSYNLFDRARLDVQYRNWSAPTNGPVFVGGSMQGTFFPYYDVPGQYGWIKGASPILSGPGLVSFTLTGTVTLLGGGGTCTIPGYNLNINTSIGGVDGGIPFSQNEYYPVTADLNGDGVVDDAHCGNLCDKKKDQLVEKQEDALRVKVCYKIDKAHDQRAFKACKQSGLGAIKAREGRGWDCWYKANRNGWRGPTAPENKPKQPNGSTYTGPYYGDGCGYQVPVTVSTMDTDPEMTVTTDAIPGDADYVATQALFVSPDSEIATGSVVTVEWQYIPNPTSTDWVVLYNAAGSPLTSTKRYTNNCSASAPGSGTSAFGSCDITLPSSATAFPGGFYTFRLYHNAGNTSTNLVEESNQFERVLSNCELNPNNCSE